MADAAGDGPTWRLLRDGAAAPALNLATDEALLLSADPRVEAGVRFALPCGEAAGIRPGARQRLDAVLA